MPWLLAELRRRNATLYYAGWLQLVALGVVLVVAPFDDRTILGLNPWIKPIKFLISVGVYLWTVAWYLGELRGPAWARRTIGAGISLAMTVENVCVVMQSARGVRSHFNFESAFDGTVFGVMGVLILVNSLLLALLALLLFVRPAARSSAYVWSLRLGVLLLLAGSAEGGVMIANGAHAVGVADGGSGLPFVNWSVDAGDLRIAHGVLLHAFQALPLFALLTARLGLGESRRTAAVFGFGLLWAVTGLLVFLQANAGRPLLPL